MRLIFTCTCGQKTPVAEDVVGRTAKCRNCGRKVVIEPDYLTDLDDDHLPDEPADDEPDVAAAPFVSPVAGPRDRVEQMIDDIHAMRHRLDAMYMVLIVIPAVSAVIGLLVIGLVWVLKQ